MYQLFGPNALSRWFAYVAGATTLLVMLFRILHAHAFPVEAVLARWAWTSLGTGVFVSSFLFFTVGNSRLFPLLCRLPVLRSQVPDLDGDWTGTVESNWSRISQRWSEGDAVIPLSAVSATLRIKVRLLSISITMDTTTRYSDSETSFVGIRRSDGGVVSLTYVYQNRTPSPQKGDTGLHDGAARLQLSDEGGRPTLRGSYWTNRNWQEGKNTAGSAVFHKV